MLVLTRKLNERIVIGDGIRVTIVGIRGNHVRLGIEAPSDLTILRDELKRYGDPASVQASAGSLEDSETAKGVGPIICSTDSGVVC